MAGMQDLKKVGRVGLKALIYFEVASTIALLIGLIMVNLTGPGRGMNINAATLDTSDLAKPAAATSFSEFILKIIPENIVSAFAEGNLLQILLFSILCGYVAARLNQKAKPFIDFLRSFSDILFGIIHIIMKLAPIGAFGAMAFTVGKYGLGSIGGLIQLLGTFYFTCVLFILLVPGLVLYLLGINLFKFLRYLKEELLIVLGTSSSEAALPGVMEKMENAGCSKPVVGLVIPTGYSFNLDGTSIYLTMAAIFIAQATNTPMNLTQQLSLLLVLLLTSKGAAGVTGSGFITLAATLPMTGIIPVAGLTLIFGIDRFMSEARALTNLIGNATATVVVASWENEFDRSALPEIRHKMKVPGFRRTSRH
jgi:aerobic C4-dicarboxylate transport protein